MLAPFTQSVLSRGSHISLPSPSSYSPVARYVFHYLVLSGVFFITLTDKGYPKKLAFQYLEELSGEFGRLYGTQVDTVSRPYAFIKFGER